jgi:hypothetical protein
MHGSLIRSVESKLFGNVSSHRIQYAIARVGKRLIPKIVLSMRCTQVKADTLVQAWIAQLTLGRVSGTWLIRLKTKKSINPSLVHCAIPIPNISLSV